MYIGVKFLPFVDTRGKVHIHKRCIMMCECGCEQLYVVFPFKRLTSKYISRSHRASANFKGRTYVELYGKDRASEICLKHSKSMSGENHFLHNTTFDDFYGERAKTIRQACSLRSSGARNPRYGCKPSSKCARGISGTYKGTTFRSSYELAFLMYADKNGWFEMLIAEPFSIPYMIGNTQRTYWPDFLRTDTRQLFEIKPQKHTNANVNHFNEKKIATQKYASINNYEYIVIDETLVDQELSNKQRTRAYLSTLEFVSLF